MDAGVAALGDHLNAALARGDLGRFLDFETGERLRRGGVDGQKFDQAGDLHNGYALRRQADEGEFVAGFLAVDEEAD